ncbi:MAG: hypothetical protein M1609_10945 [Firmicutes bacterium]|nr:hypothetical protein [Bacillota bacterium]
MRDIFPTGYDLSTKPDKTRVVIVGEGDQNLREAINRISDPAGLAAPVFAAINKVMGPGFGTLLQQFAEPYLYLYERISEYRSNNWRKLHHLPVIHTARRKKHSSH